MDTHTVDSSFISTLLLSHGLYIHDATTENDLYHQLKNTYDERGIGTKRSRDTLESSPYNSIPKSASIYLYMNSVKKALVSSLVSKLSTTTTTTTTTKHNTLISFMEINSTLLDPTLWSDDDNNNNNNNREIGSSYILTKNPLFTAREAKISPIVQIFRDNQVDPGMKNNVFFDSMKRDIIILDFSSSSSYKEFNTLSKMRVLFTNIMKCLSGKGFIICIFSDEINYDEKVASSKKARLINNYDTTSLIYSNSKTTYSMPILHTIPLTMNKFLSMAETEFQLVVEKDAPTGCSKYFLTLDLLKEIKHLCIIKTDEYIKNLSPQQRDYLSSHSWLILSRGGGGGGGGGSSSSSNKK